MPWIVEAVSLAYSSKGLMAPSGAHSTRGMSASWALFKGVTKPVKWLVGPHPFSRFYKMNVITQMFVHAILCVGS